MDKKFEVYHLDTETLNTLYSIMGIRAKEIGSIFGLSEDAILKQLKKNNIPTLHRSKKRDSVEIIFKGKRKRNKELTDDILIKFCKEGKTDSDIGSIFGMTGEGVAYRRKKIGLSVSDKWNQKEVHKKVLFDTPKEDLASIYYSLTTVEISKKLNLSKTLWLPYFRSIGLIDKNTNRINSYPPFTKEQISVIIGGLLGDGSTSTKDQYYEFHSSKQRTYLESKFNILKPYVKKIKDEKDGSFFRTVHHPNFIKFYEKFYTPGVSGKRIPLNFIKEHWADEILAYWFFDDGSYDESSNHFWISNYCVEKKELIQFVDFINNTYDFKCTITRGSGVYLVNFPVACHDKFVDLLFKVITPDLCYKIPEKYLTIDMVDDIDISSTVTRPKIYRLASIEKQKRLIEMVFRLYRKKGFPYSLLTDKRKAHLLSSFLKVDPILKDYSIAFNSTGMALCETFFPNIYECYRKGYKAPTESWGGDGYLRDLIKNRFKYAKLISDSTLRVGIKLSRACVSNFKPIIAKFLYAQYCSNGKVLDYSSGFGSRLLAARSLGIEYTGFEPSGKTYENLLQFNEFLSDCGGKAIVHKKAFEDSNLPSNYFSFAFSSPPYFDYENYELGDSQSIVRYPDYNEWLRSYWGVTVKKCLDSLTEDGRFSYCLSVDLCKDMIVEADSVCNKNGFFIEVFYKAPFKDVFNRKDRYEIIVVYGRVDKKITIDDIYRTFDFSPLKKKPEFFYEVDKIRKRRSYQNKDMVNAQKIFKDISPTKGTSREFYADGSILGVPSHILEKYYGGWNAFIVSCDVSVGYQASTPIEHVKSYLDACVKQNEIMSFYRYEKVTGNHRGRLKRLFNKGHKYHHLNDRLKDVALKPELWDEFLGLLE